MKDRFDRRVTSLHGPYGQSHWGQATVEVMDTLESVWLWCNDHDVEFKADAATMTSLIIARHDQIVDQDKSSADVEDCE